MIISKNIHNKTNKEKISDKVGDNIKEKKEKKRDENIKTDDTNKQIDKKIIR